MELYEYQRQSKEDFLDARSIDIGVFNELNTKKVFTTLQQEIL